VSIGCDRAYDHDRPAQSMALFRRCAIVKLILLAVMGVETWHEASRPSPTFYPSPHRLSDPVFSQIWQPVSLFARLF
jgi:hypothetical protein